jgi:hypothetical protein
LSTTVLLFALTTRTIPTALILLKPLVQFLTPVIGKVTGLFAMKDATVKEDLKKTKLRELV